MTRKLPKITFELILVFIAISLATVMISNLYLVAPIQEYQHLFISLLFLLTASRLAQREPDGMRRYGIDMCGVLSPPKDKPTGGFLFVLKDLFRDLVRAFPALVRETLMAIFIAAIIFPFFIVGFYFWHAPDNVFTFQPQSDFLFYLAAQLVMVGLPEEALFRGYFQTRLGDVFIYRISLKGILFSPAAILIQALLFALIHFAADPNPYRLAVFFPAVLFGIIRTWRKGIGAAIVFHALCNILSDLLVRGWL